MRETNGDIGNEATLSVVYVATEHIGGTFWIDQNGDDQYDGGNEGVDEPVAGAAVELLDANGHVVSQTTTDAEGLYGFDVTPGAYQVRFILPQSVVDDQYTLSDMGINGATVSGNTLTYPVDVKAGEVKTNVNAAANCGCAGIVSDSADVVNIWTLLFMIFGLAGMQLFFRREEERA